MKVLIVEDGSNASNELRRLIDAAKRDCVVQVALEATSETAIAAFEPDAIFIMYLANGAARSGHALSIVRRIRQRGLRTPVVVFADRDGDDVVRRAMRAGAQDVYFEAELDSRAIGALLDQLHERLGLAKIIAARDDAPSGPVTLVGQSAAMRSIRRIVARVGQSSAPVVILGDTGTGKGLVARAIHDAGPRRHHPYVAINCAATPASLMESVMFGHERGSFTGAFKRQHGHFDVVGAGTILLDEIADFPVDLQAKLLRAVEERRFRPIGATEESTFSGRIVAATNADLRERMQAGRFRSDLFYRLGVLVIKMPSLADRSEDIPDLLAAFAASAERPVCFTDEAIRWLSGRSWPGNVRELKNAVERLSVFSSSQQVGLDEVREHVGEASPGSAGEFLHAAGVISSLPGTLPSRLEAVEEEIVKTALRDANGNRSAAARALGVNRRVVDRYAPSSSRRGSRRPGPSDS